MSLGKVESVLKIHNVIDQICIYAKPTESYTIGLVVPDEAKLMALASNLITKKDAAYEDICSDPAIIKELLKQISTHGLSMGLEKFEIPKQISLISEQWTPDSGMVTAAMKLKRKEIESRYASQIENMYSKQPVAKFKIDENRNKNSSRVAPV